MDSGLVCVGLGFGGTVFSVSMLRPIAVHWGVVDRPGGRKHHRGEVPLVGGTALFAAVTGGWAILHMQWPNWMPVYLLAAGVLVVIGALDDRYDLDPKGKFLLQTACTLGVIYYGSLVLDDLGDLFGAGAIHTHAFGVAFTAFAVLGVTNAINMFDGANGLAGGTSLVSTLGFSFAAAAIGAQGAHSALLLLAGALGGFLLFNYRLRKFDSPWVFLGDAGALFLGFTLAFVAVFLSQLPGQNLPPIVAVWIGGMPLLEIGRVVGRRLAHGVNPLRADRSHVHHCLLGLGIPERWVVVAIWLCQAMLTTVGLASWWAGYSDAFLFYGFVLLFLVYSLGVEWACRTLARRGATQ
ncbi:MAG: undecaprenyl/decaprenyl-phosphate alpha-N-acetylglucosaminyl 1-phosphate transferase [Nitrococcus sp.]|nr:undecaprenyl/decaprenyl-phosphate alpha-N-acetylglucosaminyl 1-phosphate transferase [Nitrococcus sp.]